MANWASTSYRIEGKQSDLQKLYELCEAFENDKRPVMKEDAANDWEGNIILALGIDIEDSYLRGFIQSYELTDGLLSIEAEEAWGVTDFRHILENHFEDMKVYYIVEEEGCEVYETNDSEGKYFSYKYVVDSSIGGKDEYEVFNTQKDVLKYVASCLKRDSISFEDIDSWNESHEYDDDYISIHEYQIVD